jgi:23S rRNA pseudouridine2457 synthase
MHYILYKPYGYISQFKTVAKKKKLLSELFDFPEGIMAIGRLDEDSEGLLFLTKSGKLSELVRQRNIEKEYYVQVDGIINSDALVKLSQGVVIGFEGIKYLTQACQTKAIEEPIGLAPRPKKIRDDRHGPTSWISLVIKEGKNRQVRKMCAAVGFPVLRLVRVRIGNTTINNLEPGQVVTTEWFDI